MEEEIALDDLSMNVIAKRKAQEQGVNDTWEPFFWSLIGTDGILIRGAEKRLLKSGPRKGQLTQRDMPVLEVVVTRAEQDAYDKEVKK